MPPSNSFLTEKQLGSPEESYPLDVYFCKNCNLVQLLDIVSPDELFKNYAYFTGASLPMKQHFALLAEDIIKTYKLTSNSLVVDIGGNDGSLLSNFKKHNIKVLNVEPSANVAKVSRKLGIDTVNDYWNSETASKIYKKWGKAKVILATNVFAHVDDSHSFLEGVDLLLEEDGVFVVEVPYLVDLLEKTEFDTIYHEHLSYFAIKPMEILFEKHNLKIVDVKRIWVHGGSIRIYANKKSEALQITNAVSELLALEKKLKLNSLETYEKFAEKVRLNREKLQKLLEKLKKEGKKIIGYGAPAKGNVLLNYCKIGTEFLDYVVDTTSFKQGKYTPGMHLYVFPVEKIREDNPDFLLLLAWNYSEQIFKKEKEYQKNGGKFIIPIPEPKIVP
jgi:SAM-dependent methyltransferase